MRHKIGTASMLSLTILCCSGWTAPDGCGGPSGGTIVAVGVVAVAVIAVPTVILLHAHHAHHNVKGCTVAGSGGLEILEGDEQTPYLLTGLTRNIQPGHRFHLDGDKIKPKKGTSNPSTFAVNRIDKDYGMCHAAPVAKPLPDTSAAIAPPATLPPTTDSQSGPNSQPATEPIAAAESLSGVDTPPSTDPRPSTI